MLRQKLNLSPELFANLHTFNLCNTNITTCEQLTAIALLIYATYTATNHFRHHHAPARMDIPECLTQWMREGAKHHANATRTLDNIWNPHRRTHELPPIPSHM